MIVSRNWLQTYFKDPLPTAAELAAALTMHAFEIESVEERGGDALLDVKVLPNRAHDCLSHGGIARELAAIMGTKPAATRGAKTADIVRAAKPGIEVFIEDPKLCRRYIGCLIEGVKAGPAPAWLKERLESVGSRSINNIVDVTNFVMLDVGQPMHAFDADKVKGKIAVRNAKSGERITTLDGRDIELDPGILLIADDEGPLALAGIKGGNRAEVDAKTTRIILESANFHPGNVRKTAQTVNLKTDASKRFENEIAPELAETAMSYAVSLVSENAAGEGFTVHANADAYPKPRNPYLVGTSVSEINKLLGTQVTEGEVSDILDRFGWDWKLVSPRERILELAPKFLDAPYRFGASVSCDAPREFDCSSFTAYLYAHAGIAIPRLSIEQYFRGTEVSEADARPGDLVFSKGLQTHYFDEGATDGIGHVGVYLGDGKVIHASGRSHARKVVIEEYKESPGFEEFRGMRRLVLDDEKRFVVTVPAERLDIRGKHDLIEEIGRIYGYDKVPTAAQNGGAPAAINKNFHYAQKIRNILAAHGFDEVQTYAFRGGGESEVANPLAADKSFLRADLDGGLVEALEFNARYADLLGLDEIRVFEIGTIFKKDYEDTWVGIGVKNARKDKKPETEKVYEACEALFAELGLPYSRKDLGRLDVPVACMGLQWLIKDLPEPAGYGSELATPDTGAKYRKISQYPFVLRDIAVWVPSSVMEKDALSQIVDAGGELLAKYRLFDVFTKKFDDGTEKTSYAFRLVFQSMEKTLSDDEVNEVMKRVESKLNAHPGWAVR